MTVTPLHRTPSSEPELSTALLYRRVSLKEQAEEGVSLDAQLAESRRYAVRQEWVLGEEFHDVETGRRDDRQDYQRMLIVIRAYRLRGQTVVLVVASLDRLGRNVKERVRVWEEMKQLGVPIYSVREGGLISEFTYNILASVAQEESRKLSERVSSSNLYFVDRGWLPVGRPAWGYRWRDAAAEERAQGAPNKVLEPHPDEAPYAREAWQRRADGEPVFSLYVWIRSLPASARGPRTLGKEAVRQLLQAPVYVGRFEDGRLGRWEPLIDQDTWERAQARRDITRRMPAQASGEYPLTGLLRCFRCGSRMSGRNNRTTYRGRIYRVREYTCDGWAAGADRGDVHCWTTVPARAIEGAVLGTVGELLEAVDRPAVREAARRAWVERERAGRADGATKRIATLEQTLQATRRRISAASVKFLDGDLDRTAYDIVRADLQAELEAAEAELARLRGRERPAPLPPMDAILAGVGGWAAALKVGKPAAVRDVLGTLIERTEPIRVGHGKYEARLDWAPIGRGLLAAAVTLAPSPNLVSVDQLGKARLPALARRPS